MAAYQSTGHGVVLHSKCGSCSPLGYMHITCTGPQCTAGGGGEYLAKLVCQQQRATWDEEVLSADW